LKRKTDGLKKKIENDRSKWFTNQTDLQKNITVEDSLPKRIEVIPQKSVLGGVMECGKIEPISKNCISAAYSNGLVEGISIY
jgi:hypothetical protein